MFSLIRNAFLLCKNMKFYVFAGKIHQTYAHYRVTVKLLIQYRQIGIYRPTMPFPTT